MRSFAIKAVLLLSVLLPVAAQKPQAESGGIAAKLQPFIENRTLAGAVTLVASKDKMLDLEAVGYADIAAKKPMRTDSLFWIASHVQADHRPALMMLVDEGKVNVDDPVEKYLPEFKGQMVAVEQDKDHVAAEAARCTRSRSGTCCRTPAACRSSRRSSSPTLDLFPLRDGVRSYAMSPLEFEPDTQVRSTPTRASTPRAASSKSSAACRTRSSSTSGSSSRWA